MAYEIIYTKFYSNKLKKLLNYLEKEWSTSSIKTFEQEVDAKMIQLSKYPFIGSLQRMKNVRSSIVGKHNRLYYRIKGESIIIIDLLDMRIDPAKNPYKK